MVEDEDEAGGEDAQHVDAQRQQEEEEVTVVPPPDAVIHPGAVVVEVLRRAREEERYTLNIYVSCPKVIQLSFRPTHPLL